MTERRPFASLVAAVLLLSGCAGYEPPAQEIPAPAAVQPVITAPAAPVERAPDYAAMRIGIAGTGDIMLGTDFPENHLPDDDGIAFLAQVTPILESADIAFGNLEGVLVDGGEPAKQCKDPNACYLFRSPERYALLLRAAGFDVMSLANNHARDFGEAGRDASMAALARANILHSGREGDIASWRQGKLSFALIAFSPTVDSWPLLEIDVAVDVITELAADHDIVIVSFHGGAEGFEGAERIGFGMEYAYGEQRGNVVEFAHAVIDAGADLALGHGPHVPRAMELYNDRLIAYSLGNFATYYGIGVSGAKGYAPIVVANIDGFGRFVDGRVHSNIQVRPGGPRPDPELRALTMIRELTSLDFPDGQLVIGTDGSLNKKPAVD
ncbi:MAG: CapA family protein [Gammaproteobacteria bacterium]|nr:CapA family protein [Gammaproteobacteria bacterium]